VHISTVKDVLEFVCRAQGIVSAKDSDTITETACKMKQNSIGCVLVLDSTNKLIGILSERDLINKLFTINKSPDQILVKELMTVYPITCGLDASLSEVEETMAEHNIRHVPVVENGEPIGMLSSRDVLAYRLKTNRESKDAAEEIARISMSLKSLDFEDLIELAIHVSPTLFNAEKAALCLYNKNKGVSRIHRNCCMMSKDDLTAMMETPQVRGGRPVICKESCKECKLNGKNNTRLVIPLFVHDQSNDNRTNDETMDGFLCICDFTKPTGTTEELIHYKACLLQELLIANMTNAKLFQDYQRARHDSETDPLTGARTRRAFDNISEVEYIRAVRYNHDFCIGILDLDNFKRINDSGGHIAGDFVLQFLSKTIDKLVRKTDVFCRYGGDEFVLLMPETSIKDAKIILERIRSEVSYMQTPGGLKVSFSCGVANWLRTERDTLKDIFKRADAALYEAKRLGKNRVTSTEELENLAACSSS
jgi:diguanylate cyclase (GGDEF)-like protein